MDLVELQAAVRAFMSAGRSLGEAEAEIIEPCGLDDEAKAALWLYAWSFVPPRDQRSEALRHIGRLVDQR